MKRPRHVVNTVSKALCRSVAIAILLAVTSTAPAAAATLSRWTVAADSGATTPQSPAPAPTTPPPAAPAPTTPPPVVPPPVAPAVAPPPAPAPQSSTGAAQTDTTAARADTLGAPPPAVAPAPALAPAAAAAAAAPAAAPLTKKQQRKLDKQKARDAKNAARKAKKPDTDPLASWNRGKTWVMVRAGYAKSTEPGAASGAGGAGLGIQRFLTARWALGLVAQGDLLGKFGGAAEIEYPVTLDITRHFRWQTALRPYLGAGGGAFRHTFFRTGGDEAKKWNGGAFMVTGANMPLTERAILGIEGRMAFVGGDPAVTDPVFGPQRVQQTHYSIKLAAGLSF